MSRPSRDYTRCPACHHRTVLFRFGRGGEDYYACTYHPRFTSPCGWSTFAAPEGWDTKGRRDLEAWQALNPAHDTLLAIFAKEQSASK